MNIIINTLSFQAKMSLIVIACLSIIKVLSTVFTACPIEFIVFTTCIVTSNIFTQGPVNSKEIFDTMGQVSEYC